MRKKFILRKSPPEDISISGWLTAPKSGAIWILNSPISDIIIFFEFIPENEFWIDKEHKKGETRYYIDHMLIEYRLLSEGKSPDYAEDKANMVERRERNKSKLISTAFKEQKDGTEIIEKVHKELLKDYSKKIKVWVINGELVRGLFCVDFTEAATTRSIRLFPKTRFGLMTI